MRVKITLACTECKQRNYDTYKNKKNDPDRLEMNKYCRFCKKRLCTKRPNNGGSYGKEYARNQNGEEEEVKEVRISREELKQARREAKAAKKPLPKKKNFRRPSLTIKSEGQGKDRRQCETQTRQAHFQGFQGNDFRTQKVTWLKGKAVLQSTLIVCVVVLVFW